MLEKLQHRISILNGNYIAVHIRRTDHVRLAQQNGKYTTDDEFYKFIENYIKRNYR